MEVKELMLGDLVDYNGISYYVSSIENLGGLVCVETEVICELVADTELQPIPLTTKILEKNGFEIKEILHQYRWSIFYGNMLILSKVKFDYEIQMNGYPHKILYVHELQHALRLCGLDDLATNFRV